MKVDVLKIQEEDILAIAKQNLNRLENGIPLINPSALKKFNFELERAINGYQMEYTLDNEINNDRKE